MDKTVETLLTKAVQEGATETTVDKLRKHILLLYKLADIDALTQLFNRRALFLQLQMRIKNAIRENNKFVVIMLDIDHFKKVNDTYGHTAGDNVLINFAAQLKALTRENDIVARLGGEEFVIVAHYKDKKSLEKYVDQKIRKGIESNVNIHGEPITVSIGVTHYKPLPGSLVVDIRNKLVNEADQALYKAKRNGRNKVEYYTDK